MGGPGCDAMRRDATRRPAQVRRNIAAVGGDASRVTIFGESAGASLVACHMVSPPSGGLFHGAIMQSGAFDNYTVQEQPDANFGAFAARAGVSRPYARFREGCKWRRLVLRAGCNYICAYICNYICVRIDVHAPWPWRRLQRHDGRRGARLPSFPKHGRSLECAGEHAARSLHDAYAL